jgi:hypothetical protein
VNFCILAILDLDFKTITLAFLARTLDLSSATQRVIRALDAGVILGAIGVVDDVSTDSSEEEVHLASPKI